MEAEPVPNTSTSHLPPQQQLAGAVRTANLSIRVLQKQMDACIDEGGGHLLAAAYSQAMEHQLTSSPYTMKQSIASAMHALYPFAVDQHTGIGPEPAANPNPLLLDMLYQPTAHAVQQYFSDCRNRGQQYLALETEAHREEQLREWEEAGQSMILPVPAQYQQGSVSAGDLCSVFVSSQGVVHGGARHPQSSPVGWGRLYGPFPGPPIDLKHLACFSGVMSTWEVSGSSGAGLICARPHLSTYHCRRPLAQTVQQMSRCWPARLRTP